MGKIKTKYIIFIGLIIAAIALILSVMDDVSTYATFDQARGSGQTVKLVGQLAKDKEVFYKPEEDPNYFSFYMRDSENAMNKVVLLAEKPQDFERSEQIVLTGKMKNDVFLASDMLMKCPSKYKDEEIHIKGATALN